MNHFDYRDGVLCAEDVPLPRDRRGGRHAVLLLFDGDADAAFQRLQQGVRRPRRAGLLCDEGQLQPGRASSCSASSAPAPTWCRKASCAARWRPAFRRRRSCSPASARRRARWISRSPPASTASTSNPSRSWSCCRARAVAAGVTAPVSLRINPDVDARTHGKISTGKAENKFGIPWQRARAVYAPCRDAARHPASPASTCISAARSPSCSPSTTPSRCCVELVGTAARRRPRDRACRSRRRARHPLPASTTTRRRCPTPMRRSSRSTSPSSACKVIFEPGRLIVGNAGILVTRGDLS